MDRGSDTETGVLLPSGCRVTHGTGANVKTRFESLPLIMHELHAGGLGGGRARGFYGQFGFIPFAADFRLPRHVHIAKSGEAGGGELVAERILVVNGVGLGHRLIMTQPDSDRGELHRGEEVIVPLVIPGCDSTEVFETIEEAFDQIAVSVKEGAEGRASPAVFHRAYVRPGAAGRHLGPQRIGVVGPIRQQDIAVAQGLEHTLCTAAVMRLAGGQLERDRQTLGIDQRVDLGGQAATRTAHATGSVFF